MGRQHRAVIYHAFPTLCLIAITCLVATITCSRSTATIADSSVARDRKSAEESLEIGTARGAGLHHVRHRRYIILTPVRQQQPSRQSQNALSRSRLFDKKYGKMFAYSLRKVDRNNLL
ncbi:Uncharacterized protein FWK35_00021521 [Aphis craccivora]|uniref:Uncharacterized protein n=1 Tax=Aphis craccivora TaxID=307492 RepID=A0A6G0YZ83_APHCR|nr:Uncharacterized protein FWK35_00021521 [Aphis craccivora]